MKQKKAYQIFTHSASILIIAVMLFPMFVMVLGSFRPGREVFSFNLIPNIESLTVAGYQKLLTNPRFIRSYRNTFISSIIITLVALTFASMAAFALAKLHFPGKNGFFLLIISTMMVPFSLLMLPLFIIIKNIGMMDSLWGVILPSLPRAYGVFLIRQFMRSIPDDLMEAAKIDGCTYRKLFTRIVLPLTKPILFTLSTTMFLTSWNNYTWPMIVIQSRDKRLLQVFVASFFQENITHWDLVFSSLCLSTIPTIILFFISQKFIVEGIKTSGIKG